MRKILPILLSVLLLSSCHETTFTTLKEAAKRQEFDYQIIKDEQYQDFLAKIRDFSASISASYYDYYQEFDNIVLSPLSIYMALAMTTCCSDGKTNDELTKMFNLDNEQINKYTKVLYDYETIKYTKKDTILSEGLLDNSIWFDNSIADKLNEDTLDILANDFYTSSFKVDFANQNKKTNQLIQDYVANKTHDKINQYFDLSKAITVALMNVYYLKDSWDVNSLEGLPLTTKTYNFEKENELTKTKLIQGYYVNGKCLLEQDYQSFYIDTVSNNKLYFMVPSDNKDIKDVFNYENILKTINYHYVTSNDTLNEKYFTRCLFPSFSLSSEGMLKDILRKQYNLETLFSPFECDLTKLQPVFEDNSLYVDDIMHVAKLDVDKKGLEGAAVTIVMMAESSAPVMENNIYYDFYVTKPFGVILTDANNVPLFSGVVNNIIPN